jgi:hypothetical protein
MRQALRLTVALFFLALFAGTAAAASFTVTAATADKVLQPGDVFLKFSLQKAEQLTQTLIKTAQKIVKKVSDFFGIAQKKGDPTGFHSGLYLGGGRVAEAYGGDLSSARVGIRGLEHHDGYLLKVYRPRDTELAKRAVEVATRWANATMGYLVPIRTLRSADFGRFARAEALQYGRDASRAGGPKGFKKMFCSQFVLAAYQAAAVSAQLAKRPRLAASEVRVPLGVRVHAANSSPLTLHSQLLQAAKEWSEVGEVTVEK